MAGDWIKMRSDLFTHPKVVRMASALKADKLRTVGGLMSVWCLFDEHSIDGELEGYTFDEVDDHLRWSGFSAAMCAIGWLSETEKGLSLPEFDTHNGQSAKRRAQDADRKREVRKVSASDADEKRTREEKRREEKKEEKTEREQSPTGSRLPADWVMTEDMEAFCKTERPDLIPRDVANRFADYWQSMAGAKGRKADWMATWRNWVRNEKKAPAGASNQAETPYQRSMRLRMQEAAPESARKDPSKPMENVIDFFAIEVPAKRLEIGNEPAAFLG